MADFEPLKAAEFIADAHRRREDYSNLAGELTPPTIAAAYDAQEALRSIWEPVYGPVSGLKIATTTKVMQALMGIDHPCGGMIYAKRIHTSPARLNASDFIHPMVECELAVRLGTDLAGGDAPYTAASVRPAVSEAMAAFELIEDRNAVYKDTDARTLIADNAWNAGIVIGPSRTAAPDMELNGIAGRLTVDGNAKADGPTDGPMDALAWIANLAVERNRPLRAGMVVITGSVVATLEIKPGETFRFELAGIGETELMLA
jgi:2-keto-4-pentenoate hydratase